MSTTLDGRVVLVAGANRGLGSDFVTRLVDGDWFGQSS